MLARLWQTRFGRPKASPQPTALPPLIDTDYELLFMRALDGLGAGWSEAQVRQHLAERGHDQRFADWLRRFGHTRLLKSPEPNRELAERMVQLGQMNCGELGVLAGAIGREVLREKPLTDEAGDPLASSQPVTADKQPVDINLEGSGNSASDAEQQAEDTIQTLIDAFQSGDMQGAVAAADQATRIAPRYHRAWIAKAELMMILGQHEAAIVCYDQALAIKPDKHEALSNKGLALYALGQHEAAIACYDQALAIKPDLHEALSNKGNALYALGQHEAAIACYDQALAIKPDKHEALYNKGNALYALGQKEAAIACYDQALAIKPDKHEALYNKGLALYALGQKEAAIACYDQALAIKPDKHEAWLNRGIAAGSSWQCATSMRFTLLAEMQDSELDKRGYAGELACYHHGLQYVTQAANPQGWGLLHREMGKAHFFHGRFTEQTSHFCRQAIAEYKLALATLTAEAFPQEHLTVLQLAIRAYLGLGDLAQATSLREQGLAVFRDLLNSQPSPRQRELLELKFSGFSQLAVDILVQQGSLTAALETAERYKNRTLTWMLDTWQETIISPSLAEMGALLNSTTALVVWHLSPDALTQFVVLPGEAAPQITATVQLTQRLDTWIKQWNNDYKDYRAKGKTEDSWQRQQHP